MKVKHKDARLKVQVKGDKLVISIGIETLKFAFEHSEYARPYNNVKGKHQQALKVIDAEGFAKDVANFLQDEEEDGTTVLHTLLDKACESANEQGSEYIDDLMDSWEKT